jgi:hypothetical protein
MVAPFGGVLVLEKTTDPFSQTETVFPFAAGIVVI